MLWSMAGMAEPGDDQGHRQSQKQGERQFEPVVGMKLQLRQQVRARDAEKCSRAERERATQPPRMRVCPRPRPR
jgi:hypothetical protein